MIPESGKEELMPMMANSCPIPSAITSWSNHALDQLRDRNMDQEYLLFVFSDASPSWNGSHGSWNYTDGTVTICVNPQGVVTTVFWNYDDISEFVAAMEANRHEQ